MKVTVKGLKELQKKLGKDIAMTLVKDTVRVNGQEMRAKVIENANFTKGYQTGTTKRSIGLGIIDGGMTAQVEPKTEYSPYLEYGTRFMDAQPFVKPAFDEQKEKFKKDMDKLVR